MDPRTAYLRCHELQYNDFTSVQGLLEAMKDYQRMAPDQLSNDNLISILWNKVPFKLQKEVGEVKDWSLQELLQRLLRAEARAEERERRTNQVPPRRRRAQTESDTGRLPRQGTPAAAAAGSVEKAKNREKVTGGTESEMELKNVKCFGCHKKGHMVSNCPKKKKEPTRMIQANIPTSTSNNTAMTTDPWIRVLSAIDNSDANKDQGVPLVGPAYKVNVVIEGVKTRALIDNGSQVSLVRRELLPSIKEHNNWTLEQCHEKDRPLKAQPVGASGHELGAESVVAVETTMEQTGQKVIIPCFVMTSAKPIWQGTVMDCAMVLGSNALAELGLQLVQADGSVVSPTTSDSIEPTMAAAVRGVVLVEATTAQTVGPGDEVGIVTPVEAIMASKSCDLLECLWIGTTKFTIELNNWGMEPIIFKKGQQVGTIEPATVIPADDPLWTDADPQVLLCQSSSTNTVTRQGELKERLQYGEDLATADKQNLE